MLPSVGVVKIDFASQNDGCLSMGSLHKSKDQLKTAHKRVSRDLEAAASVQQSLLLQAAPEVPVSVLLGTTERATSWRATF